MKFIVDAQLPPALCIWLRGKGHDAMHVYDPGLGAASDHVIPERAMANNAFLISKDEDFLILRLPDWFGFI
jgi:predicted nuclease of predicted toxin-antitoxin system